nr:MAG TPA: hypothetical protein [Caudoviricetes sp.]
MKTYVSNSNGLNSNAKKSYCRVASFISFQTPTE